MKKRRFDIDIFFIIVIILSIVLFSMITYSMIKEMHGESYCKERFDNGYKDNYAKMEKGYIKCCKEELDNHEYKEECKVFKVK